jgi:hypothetical protein
MDDARAAAEFGVRAGSWAVFSLLGGHAGRGSVWGMAVMELHLLAGLLLGLGAACIILPALHALAGPDEEQGRVSPGWLRRHRESK